MNEVGYIQFTFPGLLLFSSSHKPERSQQIFDVKNAALFLTTDVTVSLHEKNGNPYKSGVTMLKNIGFKNVKEDSNAKCGAFAIRFFFSTKTSLMGIQYGEIPLSRMTVVSLRKKTQEGEKAFNEMCKRAKKINEAVQAGKSTSINLNHDTLNSIASVDDAQEDEFTKTPKEKETEKDIEQLGQELQELLRRKKVVTFLRSRIASVDDAQEDEFTKTPKEKKTEKDIEQLGQELQKLLRRKKALTLLQNSERISQIQRTREFQKRDGHRLP